jgi:hypothetical protein
MRNHLMVQGASNISVFVRYPRMWRGRRVNELKEGSSVNASVINGRGPSSLTTDEFPSRNLFHHVFMSQRMSSYTEENIGCAVENRSWIS